MKKYSYLIATLYFSHGLCENVLEIFEMLGAQSSREFQKASIMIILHWNNLYSVIQIGVCICGGWGRGRMQRPVSSFCF